MEHFVNQSIGIFHACNFYGIGAMGATPAGDAVQISRPSFKARFKAWWEGYEVAAEAPAMQAAEPPPGTVAAVEQPPAPTVPVLDRAWVKVAQQIWGEGFTRPGGRAFILGLVKPFAVNPSMTVMDFGAELGGGTRAVSNEFDLWVTGFEPDADLAAGGQELSVRKGAKKAEIKHYAAQDFQPKAASYDCIFSSEALCRVAEKEKLLGTFERALKPRGQISVIDIVRSEGVAADDPRLANYTGRSSETFHFWQNADYEKQLKSLKFDLRIDEDITASYRSMVIEAWVNFTNDGGSAACAKAMPDDLVAEVGLWTRRVAALDSGALQVRRYYAIKMGSAKVD